MKKIIFNLAIIGVVAAVAVGGTYAAWTASTSIEGNTISTASVSLSKTGIVKKPLTGYNMYPGDYTEGARVGIYNEGSVDLKLYMHAEDLSDTSPDGICDNTLLSLYTGHAGVTPSVDGDGKIINGQYNEAERYIITKSVLEWSNQEELTGYPPFEELGANITQVIWQQAQLDPDASNDLQGQTCTWTEVFTGESM